MMTIYEIQLQIKAIVGGRLPTRSQVMKAAKSLGLGEQSSYTPEDAQRILEQMTSSSTTSTAQKPVVEKFSASPPIAEAEVEVAESSGLAIVGSIDSGIEQLLVMKDQLIEQRANLVVDELLSIPEQLERRIAEKLSARTQSTRPIGLLERLGGVVSVPMYRRVAPIGADGSIHALGAAHD